jgi:D-glycero-D-manno-heptose 1,7-bisphosphate phosphatase
MNSKLLMIDRRWTLFLDRDGVINKRMKGDYIRNWDQFEFLPGVKDALKELTGIFGTIIVVSNQQGVGKGLITEPEVVEIHKRMADEIERTGGKIDRTYHSPHLEEENSLHRKPNVGMGLKARREFPGIDFKKSVMVGDSLSDMLFGRRLKMITIFLSDDLEMIRQGQRVIDHVFTDLPAFAKKLSQSVNPALNQDLHITR